MDDTSLQPVLPGDNEGQPAAPTVGLEAVMAEYGIPMALRLLESAIAGAAASAVSRTTAREAKMAADLGVSLTASMVKTAALTDPAER